VCPSAIGAARLFMTSRRSQYIAAMLRSCRTITVLTGRSCDQVEEVQLVLISSGCRFVERSSRVPGPTPGDLARWLSPPERVCQDLVARRHSIHVQVLGDAWRRPPTPGAHARRCGCDSRAYDLADGHSVLWVVVFARRWRYLRGAPPTWQRTAVSVTTPVDTGNPAISWGGTHILDFPDPLVPRSRLVSPA